MFSLFTMFKGSLLKNFCASKQSHIITKQANKKGGLKTLDTSRIKQKKICGTSKPNLWLSFSKAN